jgi:CrcB protein
LILGITIGLLAVSTDEPKLIYLFIAVGFCGGFSTFSTFSSEAFHFIQGGQIAQALVHIFGNMILTILAVVAGIQLSKLLIT